MSDPDFTDHIDEEDAIAIGLKVAEMADRVRVVHLACPGAQAAWAFEIDDTRYKVTVAVDRSKQDGSSDG